MKPPTSRFPVRVLVADDSPTARHLLVSLCERDPDITVVGQAGDGLEAVALTRSLRPSLVLMDVHMPRMDGLEATKTIMRESPTPIIMVTAGTAHRDVEASLSAIRLGALTVVPKPCGPGVAGFDQAATRLTSMIKALSDVRVVRRRVGTTPPPTDGLTPTSRPRLVAVAASTGGPPAVCRFLQCLPADLPVPVVVVQHLVVGFMPGLVDWLRLEVPFHVAQAQDGERLRAGTVYLAPDDRHLEVTTDLRARLADGVPVAGFRPSASALFSSLARSVGRGAVAVVLTGMGSDGLEGARALRAAGGRVLAQDEESCAVYGMPRAVTQAGLSDVVGPVEELAAHVAENMRS